MTPYDEELMPNGSGLFTRVIEYHDTPRAFRQPEFVAVRRRMLREPHIVPLTAYVESLRAKHPDWEFQDFDPMDGGVDADMLFLLEKPGPMTSPQTKQNKRVLASSRATTMIQLRRLSLLSQNRPESTAREWCCGTSYPGGMALSR
jgi:hypothetical protein